MNYKTIVLRLLEEHPVTYRRFQESHTLLSTIESQARLLKARHEELTQLFSLASPKVPQAATSSAAMEMAVQELTEHFASDSLPPSSGPLSLDAAMDYLLRHSHPA